MKYQFTMFSEQHKPVATIVEAETRMDFVMQGKPYKKAIENICTKRGWTTQDLKKYGYTKWKAKKVED